MSAAAYAAENSPSQLDVPAPRRPTGARLFRRVVSGPGNKVMFRNLRLLPFGCREMLRSVADLVAASPTGDCFEATPQLCLESVAEGIALHEGMIGPLGDIEARLAALHRAGLIELGEHSVKLHLPPEREPVRRGEASGYIGPDGSRSPSGRIGRPRKGESPQAYRARQHEANAYAAQWHREQANLLIGQRPLPMPPVAVGPTAATSPDLPRDLLPDFPRTFRLSPISPEVGAKSGLSADFPRAVGVVVKDSDKDSRDLTTPTPPTARAGDFPPDFPADFNKSAGNKSAAEKSDLSATDLTGEKISPDLHQAADQLRGVLARGLDLDPGATAKALPVILGWLEEKIPPDVLVAEFGKGIEAHRRDRAAGGRGITSVNWFAKPVRTALQALRARDSPPYSRPEAASGAASSSVALDPTLAAVPAWAVAPVAVQPVILWLLKTMARPPGSDRASRLRSIRSRNQVAFDLVAAARPEILGMADDESG